MGKLIDLTGQKFGTLQVIGRADNKWDLCGTTRTRWKVKCLVCGKPNTINSRYLQRGNHSCTGCKHLPLYEKENRMKGLINEDSPLIQEWEAFLKEKYPNDHLYKYPTPVSVEFRAGWDARKRQELKGATNEI